MKKVGKTTRPFRYDLNQIPYNYTMEMTNRFKGLDQIDRVPEFGNKEFMTTVLGNRQVQLMTPDPVPTGSM